MEGTRIDSRPGDATVAAFGRDQYRRGLSDRTIDGRRRTLAVLARFVAPRSVVEATRSDIENMLDACGLSPRSRSTYISTFRAFFEFCEAAGLIDENPARMIRPPRARRLVPRPIRDDDLAVALASADARMRAFLLLGAYQGMRAVEMAGLRREDLLLDRDPPLLVVSAAKGGNERVLPLHPEVESALRVYGLPKKGFIFSLDDGRHLKGATVSSYVGRFLRSVSVAASSHQLRHWFGTSVYGASNDLRLTQELLGHASPQTTAIYAGYNKSAASGVVNGLRVPVSGG